MSIFFYYKGECLTIYYLPCSYPGVLIGDTFPDLTKSERDGKNLINVILAFLWTAGVK